MLIGFWNALSWIIRRLNVIRIFYDDIEERKQRRGCEDSAGKAESGGGWYFRSVDGGGSKGVSEESFACGGWHCGP